MRMAMYKCAICKRKQIWKRFSYKWISKHFIKYHPQDKIIKLDRIDNNFNGGDK